MVKRKTPDPLTVEELKNELRLDLETGDFYWLPSDLKKRGFNSRYAGTKAGYVAKSDGYVRIMLRGSRYLAHRLVWFYVHGYWPNEIDHVNRIKHDNRLENLREVTTSENHRNMPKSPRNTSGITGVYYCQRDDLWVAECKKNGMRFRKSFKRKEDAIAIRSEWQAEFGYDPKHGLKGKYEE